MGIKFSKSGMSWVMILTEAFLVILLLLFMLNLRICAKKAEVRSTGETEQLSLKNFSVFISNPLAVVHLYPEVPELEAKLHKYITTTLTEVNPEWNTEIVEISLMQNHQLINNVQQLTIMEKKRSKMAKKLLHYLGEEAENFENLDKVVFREKLETVKRLLSSLSIEKFPEMKEFYRKLEKYEAIIRKLMTEELKETSIRGAYVVFASMKTAKAMKRLIQSNSSSSIFMRFIKRSLKKKVPNR